MTEPKRPLTEAEMAAHTVELTSFIEEYDRAVDTKKHVSRVIRDLRQRMNEVMGEMAYGVVDDKQMRLPHVAPED